MNSMSNNGYLVNSDIDVRVPSQPKGAGTVSFLYDPQGNRKYLTTAERTAFLKAAEQASAEVRTFCQLLAYSGARISEILALTPRQIDNSARVVVIETLKKRRRGIYRALPVPLELLCEIDRVHGIKSAQKDDRLATERIWPWCRTTAWHRVKECMDFAQLSGRRASPKGLRHGFGVSVLQSGVPINLLKKWLGHSRLSTTEIYADAVGAEEQAIAERFWKTFQEFPVHRH
jgi:integrase/recombinase XerD